MNVPKKSRNFGRIGSVFCPKVTFSNPSYRFPVRCSCEKKQSYFTFYRHPHFLYSFILATHAISLFDPDIKQPFREKSRDFLEKNVGRTKFFDNRDICDLLFTRAISFFFWYISGKGELHLCRYRWELHNDCTKWKKPAAVKKFLQTIHNMCYKKSLQRFSKICKFQK